MFVVWIIRVEMKVSYLWICLLGDVYCGLFVVSTEIVRDGSIEIYRCLPSEGWGMLFYCEGDLATMCRINLIIYLVHREC